jgi:hypothetical protein
MGRLEGSFQPSEAADVESLLEELQGVQGLLRERENMVGTVVTAV